MNVMHTQQSSCSAQIPRHQGVCSGLTSIIPPGVSCASGSVTYAPGMLVGPASSSKTIVPVGVITDGESFTASTITYAAAPASKSPLDDESVICGQERWNRNLEYKGSPTFVSRTYFYDLLVCLTKTF